MIFRNIFIFPLFRYFTCRPNYGGFVLPTSIEVLEEDGHFVNDQSDNDQIEEI